MDERQKGYASWGEKLLHHLALVIVLVCCAEALMYFEVKTELTAGSYFMKYVLAPTGMNLAVTAVGYVLIRKGTLSQRRRDEIPLYCLATVAFLLSMVHARFAVTAGIVIVPVLLSVVYGNKDTTKRVTFYCLALMILGLNMPLYDPEIYRPDDILNKVLSMIMILGAYLLGRAMLPYVYRKNEELRESAAERRRLKENLKRDAMTGLYNHVEFYRYLEETLRKDTAQIHVAVIDIDDFKKVNDTYGHERGNQVLIELSALLMKECGRNSHVSRYGGEEFTVVFTGRTEESVCGALEEVRKKLERKQFADLPVRIGVSIGVARYRAGMTPQMLFEEADEAMYLAKRSGKNQVRVNAERLQRQNKK